MVVAVARLLHGMATVGAVAVPSPANLRSVCRTRRRHAVLEWVRVEFLGRSQSSRPTRRGPDPNELGHPVPLSFVMGRNEIAAAGVTAFVAYHDGFEFTLALVFTDPQNRLTPLRSMHEVRMAQVTGKASPPDHDQFRLALSFSDGSSAASSGSFDFEEKRAGEEGRTVPPSLTLLDGSGGGMKSDLRWFVTPLTPPGPIVFSCEWPLAKISFQYGLDAGREIVDAAEKSKYLFMGQTE
jgi:hypothetical protein